MSFLNNFLRKSMHSNAAVACLLFLAPCIGSPQGAGNEIPSQKSIDAAAYADKNKKDEAKKDKAKKPMAVAKPKGSATQPSATAGHTKIKVSAGTPPPSKANSGTPRINVEAPQISYFNQDGKDWLRAGQMVHITMQGTSGALATFRVAGLSESLPMLENAPGLYIANWTVPSDRLLPGMKALVTGDLALSNPQSHSPLSRNAPTMTASLPLCVDTVPPSALNLMPAPLATSATTSPTVSVDYKDEGSGIDISSIRLILNGRDLTGEASITTERLIYKPFIPLSTGDQSVEIVVGDKAGNIFRQAWHFTIASK